MTILHQKHQQLFKHSVQEKRPICFCNIFHETALQWYFAVLCVMNEGPYTRL